MADHNDFGAWGERIAREYLITKGYTIIDYDTRKGFFEIDIIALKDNRIVFVEVKTRRKARLTRCNPSPLKRYATYAVEPTALSETTITGRRCNLT